MKNVILNENNIDIVRNMLRKFIGVPVIYNDNITEIRDVDISACTDRDEISKLMSTELSLVLILRDATILTIHNGSNIYVINKRGFSVEAKPPFQRGIVVSVIKSDNKLKGENNIMLNKLTVLTNENLIEVCESLQRFTGKLVSKYSENHYKTPAIVKEVVETNTKDGERRIDFIYEDGGFSSIFLGAQFVINPNDIWVGQMSPYEGEEDINYGFVMEVIDATNIQSVVDKLTEAKIYEPGGAHERVDRVLAEFVYALGYKEVADAYNGIRKEYQRPRTFQPIKYSEPISTQKPKTITVKNLKKMESLLDLDNQPTDIEYITEVEWKVLQKAAKNKIENCTGPTCKRLVQHWYSITNGDVPFNIKVVDDEFKEVEPKAIPFENEEGDKLLKDVSENTEFILEGLSSFAEVQKNIAKLTLDRDTELVYTRIGTYLDQLIIEYSNLKK